MNKFEYNKSLPSKIFACKEIIEHSKEDSNHTMRFWGMRNDGTPIYVNSYRELLAHAIAISRQPFPIFL